MGLFKAFKWIAKQTNKAATAVVNTVGKVADTVVNTVSNILKDPKAIAVLALNVMAPGAGSAIGATLGLSGAAATFVGNTILNTALNGGDVNAAAKSAALALGGQALANQVSSGLADSAITTATKQLIGTTVSSATLAVIQGQDPIQAIKNGGIAAGVNLITGQIDGYKDLPVPAQNAVRISLTSALKDKDPTVDLVYGAIASGLQAYKNVSDAGAVTKKELGRDLTDEEAKKFALYSSAGTLNTDIKNLVVAEKLPKAIESGQSSFNYDGKPVPVSSTDLNNYFKDKLTAAGLTPTTADINAASAAYGKSKDATSATNAIVDARTVDAQEVKDIFAKEGITNLTPQQIEAYVKSNVDEASVLSDAQKAADSQYTTKQEVLDAFKGTGYTPTDAEIDRYVGAKPEKIQTESIGLYSDLVQAFEKEQNKPSSSIELAKLAEVVSEPGVVLRLPDGRVLLDTGKAKDYGEDPMFPLIRIIADKSDTENLDIPTFEETQYDVLQAIQKSNPSVKVDELITDAFDAMQEQGYTPSIEELIDIVKQSKEKTPASVSKAAADYGDQKLINKDEVKQYLIDNGITQPTDAQINQFIKKGDEASIKKEIDAYSNPLVTTAAEAEQLLKDAGISKPTKEQIAMFTKEGLQADTQKALTTYVNPFVTTAQEVKDMFAKIGYNNPTQEEIDRYTGEKPEAVQLDMAKTYGAAALATQTYLGTKKKDVTQADIDLMTQMVSGKAAGDSRYDVTGDKKVTQEDIDYLNKYLGTGAGAGTDTFKPGVGTYWAPTGLYGEIYGNQLAQEAAAAKAAEEKAAAEKAAAAKAAADKIAAANAAKQQAYTNSIMRNMAANAPTGNVSTVVQPPSVVEAAPIFSFENPLDIGFFNQQTNTQKDTQDQPGVVKIAQGGYMDMLYPQENGGVDEILRILEGRHHG